MSEIPFEPDEEGRPVPWPTSQVVHALFSSETEKLRNLILNYQDEVLLLKAQIADLESKLAYYRQYVVPKPPMTLGRMIEEQTHDEDARS